MHRRLKPLMLTAAIAALLTVSLAAGSASPAGAEVQRIRAHFDSVLTELAARDVASLSLAQRQERASLMVTLEAYRDRGLFPRNYDFPDQATPYFVDRKTGIRCAVAHLLEATGRGDIVARVAAANNNVWVAELARDTALGTWLDEHGLTLAEAARIQVPYMRLPDESSPDQVPVSMSNRYETASATTLGFATLASLWNATANASGRRRMSNYAGLASGLAALAVGTSGVAGGGGKAPLVLTNLLAGGASVFLSTRGILRHREMAARRDAQRLSVTPTMSVSDGTSAGVAVSVRF
jgi:hypothetical protein